MVDVYISCKNPKAAYARLKNFGLQVACNETGELLMRPEEVCEHCMTPAHFDEVSQKYYFAVRMEETQAEKLNGFPDTPNFTSYTAEEWPSFAPRFA